MKTPRVGGKQEGPFGGPIETFFWYCIPVACWLIIGFIVFIAVGGLHNVGHHPH